MKKSTILGCFLCLLTVSMNAQFTQPSASDTGSRKSHVENQKTKTSVEELVSRYNNIGPKSGSVFEDFTKEEQQMLHAYFKNKTSAVSNVKPEIYPSVQVASLLSRMDKLGASDQIEPLGLFNEYEQGLLQDYFHQLYPSGQNKAPGDVYGLNLRGGACGNSFGVFPLTGPYTLSTITSNTNPIYGGDFDSTGTLYAFNGSTSTLLTLDTATGAETTIAPITGLLATETLRGIAWNEANSTMYLLAGVGEVGSIYTVNLTTGAATLVGSSTVTGWLPIWLAIDNDGNAFMADIVLDNLYSVSLTTGTATLVGALGININFAQDADFDPDTNTLYMGGYIGTGVNVFASVNTTTGAATTLGTVNADCAELGIVAIEGSGGGGTFPAPYCGPIDFTSNVEPITLVDVAGISNVTDAAVNGTPDHEDFTAINGDMEAGMSYPIALEGNTDGNFTNRFVIFIDWNQNDVLDDAGEVYEMTNLLVNSNGTDGQQVTGTIDVPADALAGTTRMRVKKQFGVTDFLDPCLGTGFGQVEDYSVNVTTGGGTGGVLDTAYGINNSNFDLIGFKVDDPSTTEVFGTSPITNPALFENAGAIDPANPTTGYVLDNGGNFYSFDVTTGFYTLLGNIPGDWVGMEFDQASGILYGIAGTSLYTIDQVGISATLVGSLGLTAGDLPIALAIDGAGVGYTYEIVSDVLYTVDLATGAATLVGSIGFDANYGQGMAYDALTDTVYMSAFNNSTFAGEWRSVDTATGMSTLIGPIVTTEATTQVAWVSIGETLPPPACPKPTDLTVTNITETTADLAWTAEPNASSGYIWYVFEEGANPVTDTPVATGTTAAGATTATANGLTNATNYDFYVVADCDSDGLSTYAGPITFATLVTPPSCGGNFYDTGGPGGDYDNNENVTTVITPDVSGDRVMVTFTAFDVESTWDALYVYDGPDATFPIISSGNPATNSGFPAGGYYGTDNPGPFTSTDESGALTFVFLSDSSVPRAGWEADVVCFTPPPANDMIVNSIDVDELGFPYTDSSVAMPAATTEDGSPAGCDLTGANGVWYNFVSEGDGTAVASIITPGGASAVTFYTAPNENAVETDLTLVPQNTNQCVPGTSSSINTVAGQAYYVFVLNTGAVTDIVIDGTNLGTIENSIVGFSFYPNPSTNTLNLKAADTIDTVSIYNLLGQRVIDTRVEATTSQIDVSTLSTGTYIMKVSVNGQIGTYKVLKK